MKAWVLDARVAAKWFMPPAGGTLVEEALGILTEFGSGRCRIIVPDLFWPEVWQRFPEGRANGTDHAKAVMSGWPLVTADERLVQALGRRFPVRWLGGSEVY